MQSGFWSVFSETGDIVGYLLCRAAENASRHEERAKAARSAERGGPPKSKKSRKPERLT